VVPMATTRPAVFSGGSHGSTRTKPATRPTTKPAGGDDGIPNSRD